VLNPSCTISGVSWTPRPNPYTGAIDATAHPSWVNGRLGEASPPVPVMKTASGHPDGGGSPQGSRSRKSAANVACGTADPPGPTTIPPPWWWYGYGPSCHRVSSTDPTSFEVAVPRAAGSGSHGDWSVTVTCGGGDEWIAAETALASPTTAWVGTTGHARQ